MGKACYYALLLHCDINPFDRLSTLAVGTRMMKSALRRGSFISSGKTGAKDFHGRSGDGRGDKTDARDFHDRSDGGHGGRTDAKGFHDRSDGGHGGKTDARDFGGKTSFDIDQCWLPLPTSLLTLPIHPSFRHSAYLDRNPTNP
jgi:hypothetical protein